MDKYVGTKIVLAERMDKLEAMQNGLLRDDSVVSLEPDGTSEAGYVVIYEDGYKSWSPKDVFERAYRRITPREMSLLL